MTEPDLPRSRLPPGWTRSTRSTSRLTIDELQERGAAYRHHQRLGVSVDIEEPRRKVDPAGASVLVRTRSKGAEKGSALTVGPADHFQPTRIIDSGDLLGAEASESALLNREFTRDKLGDAVGLGPPQFPRDDAYLVTPPRASARA